MYAAIRIYCIAAACIILSPVAALLAVVALLALNVWAIARLTATAHRAFCRLDRACVDATSSAIEWAAAYLRECVDVIVSARTPRPAVLFAWDSASGMPVPLPSIVQDEPEWVEPSFASLGVPAASCATPEPLPCVLADGTPMTCPEVSAEESAAIDAILAAHALLAAPPTLTPGPSAPAVEPITLPTAPASASEAVGVAMPIDYATLGVRELRKIASARGVRHTGLKKDALVAALSALPNAA